MSLIHFLLVEDDMLSRMALSERLKVFGVVNTATSGEEARAKINRERFDFAFVDLDLDRELEGLKLIENLKKSSTYVVVLSGREDDEIIRKAYELGADDYLSKPFKQKSIELVIKKYNQKNAKNSLKEKLISKLNVTNQDLYEQIEIISNSLLSDRPILIQGETGTGKTFLAKIIHELSGDKIPFVQVNCAEFSENLLESELFGHVAGAYTGAIKNKKGMLELANNGILFLDEIASMSPNLQRKILKAIEEKEFYPVGAEKSIKTQFRLISATCESLKEKVFKGEFRQDLYFRIEGFNINLKSLRNRKEDINGLIKFFLKQNERRIVIDALALKRLNEYSWPGNIRELQKVLDVLRAKEKGVIQFSDVDDLLFNSLHRVEKKEIEINLDEVIRIGLNNYIESIEMKIVKKMLEKNDKKVRKTLGDLKLSNNSFYRILEKIKSETGGDHV